MNEPVPGDRRLPDPDPDDGEDDEEDEIIPPSQQVFYTDINKIT